MKSVFITMLVILCLTSCTTPKWNQSQLHKDMRDAIYRKYISGKTHCVISSLTNWKDVCWTNCIQMPKFNVKTKEFLYWQTLCDYTGERKRNGKH